MHTAQPGRVDWVDYAKGFCIIMVVMMHSTLGVEKAAGAEGWMTSNRHCQLASGPDGTIPFRIFRAAQGPKSARR
jgi:hypothetical protein